MSSHPTAASSTPSSASGAAPCGSTCPTPTWRSRIRHAARETLDGIVAITLAPTCPLCREPLQSPTTGLVCAGCWASVRLYPAAEGGLKPAPTALAADGGLKPAPPPHSLDEWAAAGPFEGTLREIVHAFKYEGHWSLAGPLATLMRRAGAHLLAEADLVVPVPLHPSRRRERGFNQAEMLARGLGRPVVLALRRRSRTRHQASLSLADRLHNVRGAFMLAEHVVTAGWTSWRVGVAKERLRGASVVLVDDVATSGATFEACADVLRGVGVGRLAALTVAQAPLPRPR